MNASLSRSWGMQYVIPTVILVLRQKRGGSDVLFVDASKGFAKDGKNNKLRASDIKKICDTVIGRITVPRFSVCPAPLTSRSLMRVTASPSASRLPTAS